jgi:DNA repair exonuclease SbcCD ATPase subunit
MKSINLEELEENICYTEKKEAKAVVKGDEYKLINQNGILMIEDKFSYFNPKPEGIKIFIQGHIIPLSLQDYGFADSRIVKLKNINLEFEMPEELKSLYNQLLEKEIAPLNQSLETITKCVNDSMEFDYELIKKLAEKEEEFPGYYAKFYNAIKKADYSPKGTETIKGICSDAGRLIRKAIKEIIEDENLRCSYVSAQSQISIHDTTLILDIKKANWAVLSSKSALKKYNLVPKEKLSELGMPYRPIL